MPEITLLSGTNYSIICHGDVPVTWQFKEYGATKLVRILNHMHILSDFPKNKIRVNTNILYLRIFK